MGYKASGIPQCPHNIVFVDHFSILLRVAIHQDLLHFLLTEFGYVKQFIYFYLFGIVFFRNFCM